ncbi:MAG: hypothetical protein AB1714_21785 [Acidobacteriota bacterium]
MVPALRIWVYVFLVLLALGWAPARCESPRPQTQKGAAASDRGQFTNASGAELVTLLSDEATRARAYHELCRRADPKTEADSDRFCGSHRNPEVVVCPQEGSRPPVYVVLSEFLTPHQPSGRFGRLGAKVPEVPWPELRRRKTLLIDTYSFDGSPLHPFPCNDNALDGIMLDMNRDGFVERANDIRLGGYSASNVEVFKVERMGELAEVRLAVLYNWGEHDDWDYAFSDREEDGYVEVDFGPLTENGVMPEVTFRWNEKSKSWEGPPSGLGGHLVLLDPADIRGEIDRLAATREPFEEDPDALPGSDRWSVRETGSLPWGWARFKAASQPYRYASLKALSDEQILEYMGEAKSVDDLERDSVIATNIPASIWNMGAREAALAVANANRVPEHREAYEFIIDAMGGLEPPVSCSIAFSVHAAHSALERSYFLRCHPGGSYMVYAGVVLCGAPAYDSTCTGREYDLRVCLLTYDEARTAAHTLWWLNHGRTSPPGEAADSYGVWSTGDGTATLQWLGEDGQLEWRVTDWLGGPVSQRWTTSFGDEELIGIAGEMFEEALPARLGERWSGYKGIPLPYACLGSKNLNVTQELLNQIHDQSRRILAMFSIPQTRVSYKIVQEAVRAAGDHAFIDLLPRLRVMLRGLPAPFGPVRDECAVEKEIDALEADGSAATQERVSTLYDEISAIRHGAFEAAAIETLRSNLNESIQRILCARDTRALYDWAVSEREGHEWAMSMLFYAGRGRHIDALEKRFDTEDPPHKASTLAALSLLDKRRCLKLARRVPADSEDIVGAAALSILAMAGPVPDENRRVAALLRGLLDPRRDAAFRESVLWYLVPMGDPLKFKNPEIDATLLAMLRAKPAMFPEGSTRPAAARALYMRTGMRHFDPFVEALDPDLMSEYRDLLNLLAWMTPEATMEQRAKLTEAIRPEFTRTHGALDEILLTVWAADLRDLKPDIERIATSGPEDIEGSRGAAWSSGATVLRDRYHMARRVAAMWNEEEPLTRLKLLLAFALQETYLFGSSDPSMNLRVARLRQQIEADSKRLAQEQRQELIAFMRWCCEMRPASEWESPPKQSDIVRIAGWSLEK